MKNSEILIKAKEVISNPENWIQGYFAFDKNKSPVGCAAQEVVKEVKKELR